ncbi:MAG TPA: hypothetical protein VD978_32130 [Azospirillum sp.]|nr:hypothetical protein [Azospirillum sp.]
MRGYSDANQGGGHAGQTVRHVHVSQELRNGKLVTLDHIVFERGMAEPSDTTTIFDRKGWLAWLAREAASEFREAA